MKISLSELKKNKPYGIAIVLIGLLILTLFLVLAIKTPNGIAPDEGYHIMAAEYYQDHSIDPFLEAQDSDFHLGDLTRLGSYLYPFILSWVLRATAFIEDQRTTLRFTTILLSMVNYGLFVWLASILLKKKVAIISAIFFLYSLLMYLFLGAFVNYDNLALTFTLLMTITYLLFYKSGDGRYILLFILFSIFGSLSKYTVLPLVVIIGFLFLLRRDTYKTFYPLENFRSLIKKNWLIVIMLIFASIFFLERYGLNVVEFNTPRPDCDMIHTKDECMQNLVIARDYELKKRVVESELVPITIYVKEWLFRLYQGTAGIMGHKFLPAWDKAYFFITPLLFVSAIGALKLLYKKRFKDVRFDLIFIIIAYMAVLLFGVHWPGYQRSGMLALAVQGRYLFPVLPLGIVLLVYYAERWIKGKWIYLYLSFIVFFFAMEVYYLFNNIGLLWG